MKITRKRISHLIKVILALFVITILILWGWNSAIPDLFGLPVMKFKQAVGLLILASVVSLILRRGRCQSRKKGGSSFHTGSLKGKPL